MTKNASVAYSKLKPKVIYTLVALAISLVASFCIAANTHAAGTADVKTVFGAKGDGVTDDTTAIQAAFDSDYGTIEFPKGEYRFTKLLRFGKGDKIITGNKATLFTDDSFTTTGTFDDAIVIQPVRDSSNNITSYINNIRFQGLRFEARQTQNDAPFKTLIGIRYASEIHFDHCDFYTPPDLADPAMGALDFWTGWHNISVKNSSFRLLHDSTNPNGSGGNVAFRDIQGVGASNGEFINNVAYKYTRDEIFYITESQTHGTIENVTVSGNRFYIGDPVLVNNVYTITFSGNAPSQLKNIQFTNNEVIGQGVGHLFSIESSDNLDISNNDLYTKVSHNSDAPFAAIAGAGSVHANNPNTVHIRDNRTVTIDSPIDIKSIVYDQYGNPYHFTDNQRVTINAPNVQYLAAHRGQFSNNNVAVNGNIHIPQGYGYIINYANRSIQNNTIRINGYVDRFFVAQGVSFTQPSTISGNTITTTKKHPNGADPKLISLLQLKMNGHPLTVRDNTITYGSDIEDDTSLEQFTVPNMGSNLATDRTPSGNTYASLLSLRLDTEVLTDNTVYYCNNTTRGFRNQKDPTNGTRYPTLNLNCN